MLNRAELYRAGIAYRDVLIDFQKAIACFREANTGIAWFALAEMYQYGVRRTVTDEVRKGSQELTFPVDIIMAADGFLKAYEAFESERRERPESPKLNIIVWGSEPLLQLAHEKMQIEDVNALLEKSRMGHPEALFQLACFYRSELDCYDDATKRKISATKENLQQWEKICLTAAAIQFHPHAAYRLAKNADRYHLSSEEMLKWSVIAADADFARSRVGSGQQFIRGDHQPAATLEFFMPTPDKLPLVLFEQTAINAGRIGGIHAQSVTRQGRICLSVIHFAFVSGQRKKLGDAADDSSATTTVAPLTVEEMRAQRLRRLQGFHVPVSSSSTSSTAKPDDGAAPTATR